MSRYPHQTALKSVSGTGTKVPAGKTRGFFDPAQAHVAEPAQSALAATSTPSQSATGSSCGMDQPARPERTSRAGWSQRTDDPSASIGRCQGDVPPQTIPTGTGAQAVGKQDMELRRVLEQRECEPLTPYRWDVWEAELSRLGLRDKYPKLVQGLRFGFNLGIPRIRHTHTPPNHRSISLLHNVYSSIIANEFTAGQYIGPFTCAQLEVGLGPFQTSPLSLVPKTSKPGKYQAVHNFSHPHNPLPTVVSINASINSDDFPCTWGTFLTVYLLIARLPTGSQASVRDIAEAYRTIPASPSQWPGLVIRLQAEDSFAINTCNNFGLASAGGVYGMVADVGADIFRSSGIGPLAKWVDDHIFFRIPRARLPGYNSLRKRWQQEIQEQGERRQTGGHLWYGGKELPEGPPEEFDEDCSTPVTEAA